MDGLRENLTTLEAADYLNVSETTVKKAIKMRWLQSYKNGKSRRIKREWLLEYEARMIAESQQIAR